MTDSFSDIPQPYQEPIDKVADQFEREFRDGLQPKIEDFLGKNAIELYAYLLRELLTLELELRRELGDQPTLVEYGQRFPGDLAIVSSVFSRGAKMASTVDVSSDPQPRKEALEERRVPEWIGRYKIKRHLGRGGFGEVYLAHDPQLDRSVAIKIPRRERFKNQDHVASFIQEARTTAKLKHPLLVTVYDVQEEDGLPYIVQEYIDGENLAEWCVKYRPSLEQIVQVLVGITEALGYAHQHGLTHCDLKLANVLMDRQEQPHVADFGLAVHETVRLRRKGARFGTPAMMAPEQVRGEGHRLDGRTDIWACGVMMYEMLVSQRPFTATDQPELFNEIETLDPRPLRQIDRTIPRELERICFKCISKRRTDRYNTTDDLREDLQAWLSDEKAGELPQENAPSAGLSNSNTLDSEEHQPPMIIPKGLRSFDANDADFFIQLLPGPFGRDGLPESIRFWRDRVEETDGEATFAVGLIYGPSGCGKSSLVKAGLLPRLSNAVLPIYVEATAFDTEVRLLKQLRKHFPHLDSDYSLLEACEELRHSQQLRNRKVLLVIDQFEQWLHSHAVFAKSQLVDALRHCNGCSIQAILLVRQDFFSSVHRLFLELEIKLSEGKNYALVDRFDKNHARKVLTLFGHAYGQLADKLSTSNERFLIKVIDELAEDGKVVGVHLSLLAEMMKSRPWVTESLNEVGGVKGIGVTFLDETFSSVSSPPSHRVHEKSIRPMLETLLPEPGSDIKGGMRSARQLCIASGYAQDSPQFAEAIHILDLELRIISPTEPDGESLDNLDLDESREKYYQLTHDYLVPSLRLWLKRHLKETPKGRAELSLRERAEFWNTRPENRFLPSPWEYSAIRLLCSPKRWTVPQQKMMKAADQFYGLRAGTCVVTILLVLVLLLKVESWRRSKAAELLVTRIMAAEPYQIVGMVSQNLLLRPELNAQLRLKLNAVGENSDMQVRLRLGLLPLDEQQAVTLSSLLPLVKVQDIESIARLLRPYSQDVITNLLTISRDQTQSSHNRLKAMAALGVVAPEELFWHGIGNDAADLIIREDALTARYWGRLMQEVGPLEAPLRSLFFARQNSPAASSAAAALAEYYSTSPENLCELLSVADSQQCRILAEGLTRNSAIALEVLAKFQPTDVNAQANIVLAKLILGDDSAYWSALNVCDPDGSLRSHLIDRWQSSGVSALVLAEELKVEQRPSVVQAVLMIIHLLPQTSLSEMESKTIVDQLKELILHPDAGVHSAAELVLRKWQLLQTLQTAKLDYPTKPESQGSKSLANWYVDKNDHVMVCIDGEKIVEMGLKDPNAGELAPSHKRRIPRTFAISCTETTQRQFYRLCTAAGTLSDELNAPSLPVTNIDWQAMAKYCNLLSALNSIPPDQWCYRENETGFILADGFLEKSGYRLPTEAEWEFCCRAGTSTEWYFGDDLMLVHQYAWNSINSLKLPEPARSTVGNLMPNRLGLFDMSGNTWEVCQSKFQPPDIVGDVVLIDDSSHLGSPTEQWVIRGGSYGNAPRSIRSGCRTPYTPQFGTEYIGFRVVRTLAKQ